MTNYELMLITNEYQTASEEVNDQINELNQILKSYDKNGMLVGEAPCTKDLIEITDHDFKVVSAVPSWPFSDYPVCVQIHDPSGDSGTGY